MTARTFWIAGFATIALGVSPALAGGDCGYGSHASVPDVVAQANQSTPAENATAIPYPLPTTDEETVAVAVEENKAATSTE